MLKRISGGEMKDRIGYFENEFDEYNRPLIDEIVMSNADVHLECLDDGCFMLIVSNGEHRWHLNIYSKSGRAKVIATIFEDNGVEVKNVGKD